MTELRHCEMCGAAFTPRREHARFCAPRCRVSWNRERAIVPSRQDDALGWAITAMRETTGRILGATDWRQHDGFAVITEAVWWVTMVDATLVRYHPGPYGRLLEARPAGERVRIEDTLGGLRFVRNQMGYTMDCDQFIDNCPRTGHRPASRVAAWRWKAVTLPPPSVPDPAAQPDWEYARHRSYTSQLAGEPIGRTLAAACSFAEQAFATAETDRKAPQPG